MTQILREDEATLQRILGREDIPQQVADEYAVRIAMFHGAGHSGPMGAVGLIDLVRSLGLAPKPREEPVEQVDWRKVPQNGKTRVEALFFGEWKPGVFRGFVASGTLAVKLDDEEFVKECRTHMVRLAKPQQAKEKAPPRAKLLEPKPVEPTVPVDDGSKAWAAVAAGTPVWIGANGDEEGEYIGFRGGKVAVRIGGEEQLRDPAEVFPVE